ncbi:MAG: GH92 family glycosyl hydrolase [Spirochaetales bacterium]|nr:GH92 family glycosyl hydrolase [Spirochaetales bacterium]
MFYNDKKRYKMFVLSFLSVLLFSGCVCAHYARFTAPEQDYSNYVRTRSTDMGLSVEQTGGYGDGKTDMLIEYVDPFIGTAGHGHTFPGATTPFGMVQISPDNGVDGWDWCSGYHRFSEQIHFFSHKHLSGTGASDLGDIGIMPTYSGKGGFYGFSHEKEFASPGYYAVELDNGILAELTASKRSAVHRYTFDSEKSPKIVVNTAHYVGWSFTQGNFIRKIDNYTVVGYRYSRGWASKQRVYFALTFSAPIKSVIGTGIEKVFTFAPSSQPLILKVGLSSVSADKAMENLKAESLALGFDEVRENAARAWEKELAKIKVDGSEVRKTVFYTAMYHAFVAPNLYSDVDLAYTNPDGSVAYDDGTHRYSTFSLWDTYRAAHPLFVFTQPDLIRPFVNSMLAHYDVRGFLPIWELEANETFCMIGNHSIPVIVEAYLKGYKDFDVEKAYQACVKTANQDRKGLKEYRELGYVPYDAINESVSLTLEYAYNDFCVGAFAKALGKNEDAEIFFKRAQNYKNLFDEETKLMRPRHSNGTWLGNFDPLVHDVGGRRHYTEGNAWQYTWSVQHDVEGLISLYGSQEEFLKVFGHLFEIEEDIDESKKLVDVTGLIGQYAHGNEPSHHAAFLFNWTSKAYRTQELTSQIVNQFYTDKPDGLPGNEDCGQMSAWFVFAALGFYPVDPVSMRYELTTPVLSQSEMTLPNGKVFTVTTDKNPEEYIYIDRIVLNGKQLDRLYITYEEIMSGGKLEFFLKKEI